MKRLLIAATVSIISLVGLSANQCSSEQQQTQPSQQEPDQPPAEQQPQQ